MAESSTSTGSDAPQAPEDMGSSRNEQHWPLGDLVVDGLNGLEKHMRDPTVNPDPFLRSPFSGATKNDQHLQEFKFFRLVGLRYRIKEVCGPVNGISIAGVALIQRMQCSTKVNMTSSCLLAIELAIGWLEGSEFDLVQHHWSDPRRRIDECLEQMSSDQLKSLGELASVVAVHLRCLIMAVALGKDIYGFTSSTHREMAKRLAECFEAALALIRLHFLPLVPDTDGFPGQNYYKAWLTTWHTQLALAIQLFIESVDLYFIDDDL
ncbi:hypothetical protein PtA15_1A629 [Puccinia triticina]|uniref:Transcription factor domain-containing protein n=1 Tax=Puccinia triticina TaxID=208348 RepID=A0ABY7C8H0_9BASI|nr:uncharacterized protein PtA15_1A629 [Puccinia triticina]WAQ81289.1 hypothetical protein PtA15_1A629 [Puccinia triticina]